MNKLIILIPIYKDRLDPIEQFSLDHSLSVLNAHDFAFIGPTAMDDGYYRERFPKIPHIKFPDRYFASIQGYNHLLLSEDFYRRFTDHEFMLILQTDAILLRDELAYWCAQPFDYVGAPWPEGVEIYVNAGVFEGNKGKRIRAHVGNGGLCLRRIRKCLSLLREFREIVAVFEKSGSSEDLFFALMGGLSQDFIMPNEITASRFALELRPSYYVGVNGGHQPMGGHAWWKHEPDFWMARLPPLPFSFAIPDSIPVSTAG